MDSPHYDIDIMSQSIGLLQSLPYKYQNEEYKHIVNIINEYLLRYCQHDIQIDEIDVDIEQTKTIKYCQNCYLTFD